MKKLLILILSCILVIFGAFSKVMYDTGASLIFLIIGFLGIVFSVILYIMKK